MAGLEARWPSQHHLAGPEAQPAISIFGCAQGPVSQILWGQRPRQLDSILALPQPQPFIKNSFLDSSDKKKPKFVLKNISVLQPLLVGKLACAATLFSGTLVIDTMGLIPSTWVFW